MIGDKVNLHHDPRPQPRIPGRELSPTDYIHLSPSLVLPLKKLLLDEEEFNVSEVLSSLSILLHVIIPTESPRDKRRAKELRTDPKSSIETRIWHKGHLYLICNNFPILTCFVHLQFEKIRRYVLPGVAKQLANFGSI